MFENKSKLIVYLIFAVFFVGINVLSIAVLTVFTGSFFNELFKWLQLMSIIFLCASVFYKWKKIAIFCSSGLFFFYYITLLFFINTNINLDYSFLKRNIADINSVINPFIILLIFLLPISFLNSYLIVKIRHRTEKWHKALGALAAVIVLSPIFFQLLPTNELTAFAKTIFQHDGVINHYQEFQKNLINQSTNKKSALLAAAADFDKEKIPNYLDNIIVLQIESLNKRLISTSTTPNFLNFANQGIYFSEFYSNSVQTIFGQENLLCSLPTSFDLSLVQSGLDKKIVCLPEILNSLGYKTFFIKSYSLDFTETGKFMKNIGFSDIHADDIMQMNDPQYKWGYREDVFYTRAFDYIQKNQQARHNFLYLEIGPSNHWPFSIPNDFKGQVPFPAAKNHQERLANTTFIQDSYIPIALEKIDQLFPDKNYTLILTSDHTWPTGTHDNNIFNQQGAFEDNFLSAMAMRIGQEEKYQSKVISSRYSLMDIMPSLLDLFGLSYADNDYSRSFISELNGGPAQNNKTILIQPYSNKQISIIQNNTKTKYQSGSQSLSVFDLTIDPEERSPLEISKNSQENLIKIKYLLPLLSNDFVVMHALGGIDGIQYTNSQEAFVANYQRGRRKFEVDLTLNKEKTLLAAHENHLAETISVSDFKNKKILGKYTPLTFNDILKLMGEYPEAELIIDMKSDFSESYGALVKTTLEYEPKILDRIIPQIYHEHQLGELDKLYDFKEIIYTLHEAVTTPKKIIEFSAANQKISTITLSKAWFSKQLCAGLHHVGKNIFIHTINKEREINFYLNNGVDGIYTDYY